MSERDKALVSALTALTRAIENFHLIRHFDDETEDEAGVIEQLVDHIGDDVKAAKDAVAALAGDSWESTSNGEIERRKQRDPDAH